MTRVGIEGTTNFGWTAARYLVEAGVDVVEVPPLMTARERQSRVSAGIGYSSGHRSG